MDDPAQSPTSRNEREKWAPGICRGWCRSLGVADKTISTIEWLRISGAIKARGVTALCPGSILVRGGAKSSYLGRLSLRFLPDEDSSPQTGRVDPAGVELEESTRRLSRVPKS